MAKSKISNAQLLEDSKPQASNSDLSMITERCLELANIELRLEKWEELAKQLKERHRQLEQEIIPDLMAKVGMAEITLEGGTKLIIKDVVQGSIPSITTIEECDDPIERDALTKRRQEAFAWLKANKAADLIRNTIKADFGAGHIKAASAFVKKITAAGFKASRDENVHPGTLNKFLKERIEQGQDVPADTFKLFTGRKATLKAPKQSTK